MNEHQKKKILVIGDGATGNGFERVIKSILFGLPITAILNNSFLSM